MLYNQLLLAATAVAFLVVPEASESDREVISTLPFPIPQDVPGMANSPSLPTMPAPFFVDLPCQQCQGENARVVLVFDVEDETRLTVNGFEIYPSPAVLESDLVAPVLVDEESEEKRLGYAIIPLPEIFSADEELSLVSVRFQLLQVGGIFLSPVPNATVKLIKAPSGEIIIGGIDVEAAPEAEADIPVGPLLRIKEKVEEFWRKLSSGCGRHRHNGKQGGRVDKSEGKHGSRPPYRHDSPHGHHRHGHRHHHDWFRLIKNIAANIVLPVLAGITAGVGVAVLAMGICSLFALVFHARRRRCRRAARQSKAAAAESGFAEEKAGLMEVHDAPPEYEADVQQSK